MDNVNINVSSVNINELVRKLKNRKHLIEFCFRIGYYLPDSTVFNHGFIIKWGQGRKNVSCLINKLILAS